MFSSRSRLCKLPRLVLKAQFFRMMSSSKPRPKMDLEAMYNKLKFQFDDSNLRRAQTLLATYPEPEIRGAMMPLLDLAQRQHGWLPITAIHAVADMLKVEPFAVWEVANFYGMFNMRPVGKFRVKVCMTTPCQLRGCAAIMRKCEEMLQLKDGETSSDMEFTLNSTYCMGACVNGPVISVNEDLYEDLTVDDAEHLMCELRSGNMPPAGPRKKRFASEPEGGLTSLLAEPNPPGFGIQDLCSDKPQS